MKVRAPIFWAYVRMMPRLEAAEQLSDRAVALSTGNRGLDEPTAKRFVAELDRQAAGSARRSQKASAREIAGMGIRIVEIPAAQDDG